MIFLDNYKFRYLHTTSSRTYQFGLEKLKIISSKKSENIFSLRMKNQLSQVTE